MSNVRRKCSANYENNVPQTKSGSFRKQSLKEQTIALKAQNWQGTHFNKGLKTMRQLHLMLFSFSEISLGHSVLNIKSQGQKNA